MRTVIETQFNQALTVHKTNCSNCRLTAFELNKIFHTNQLHGLVVQVKSCNATLTNDFIPVKCYCYYPGTAKCLITLLSSVLLGWRITPNQGHFIKLPPGVVECICCCENLDNGCYIDQFPLLSRHQLNCGYKVTNCCTAKSHVCLVQAAPPPSDDVHFSWWTPNALPLCHNKNMTVACVCKFPFNVDCIKQALCSLCSNK